MSAVSFQLASIYAQAVVKLELEEDAFTRLASEIHTISEFDISRLKPEIFQNMPLLLETQRIIAILHANKKLFILKDLVSFLEKELLKRRNSMFFTVKTFAKFASEEAEMLKQTLAKHFKKSIVINEVLNPSLVGGFSLHFESYQLDFSKKAKLSKIKACFLKH